MGGFPLKTQSAQFAKLGVFQEIRPKSTQFVPNWVFYAANWYSDGSQNHAVSGIEMVEILKSTLSIGLPVQNFLKTPLGTGNNSIFIFGRFTSKME